MNSKPRVLIAGIGGASLGTEIAKCLVLAGRYEIFGCDISSFAFGHYQEGFRETFLADEDDYIGSVLDVCRKKEIRYIIPGAEQPLILLCEAEKAIEAEGIKLVTNSISIVHDFT
ncbi:MAG: carbamoyl phosphate synthase large subunit, partial [bacterium]